MYRIYICGNQVAPTAFPDNHILVIYVVIENEQSQFVWHPRNAAYDLSLLTVNQIYYQY